MTYQPSREIKSSDPGAPQMQGNVFGSLIHVLKKVLVDGFGTTAPLGWDLVFEDTSTHTAVFRPKVGCRMFVQVKDNFPFSSSGSSRVVSFESMSDANTGVFPNPTMADVLAGTYGYIVKTVFNTTAAINWNIIGDNRGFYLVTFPHTNSATVVNRGAAAVFYVGEYTSTLLGDEYNWCSSSSGSGSMHGGFSNNFVQRNPYTKVRGCVPAKLSSFQGITISFNAVKIGHGGYFPALSEGHFMYAPMYLSLVDATYTQHLLLGTMPGLLNIQLGVVGNTLSESDLGFNPTYDEYGNTKIFICSGPIRGYGVNSAIRASRYSFLIGEKFRYVY